MGKTDYDLAWERQQADSFRRDDRRVMEQNKTLYHIIEPQSQADGKKAWLDTNKIPLRDSNGKVVGILGTFEDITDRVELQEQLREEYNEVLQELRASEERLKAIFEYAPDAIYLHDLNANLIDGNRAAEQMIGRTREDLIGRNLFQLGILSMEDFQKASNILEANRGGHPTGPDEFILRRGNGEQLDIEISTFPAKIRGESLVLGVARDISERRRAERERTELERQLRQMQKMEALGALAGGIAHDFNNILSVILGYTDMALDSNCVDSIHHDLQQVRRSAFRAKELVQQILAFSRQAEHEKKPLKLNTLIKETVKLLRASIPATIEIETELSAESDWILADATQIHQVIMNLCTNAWQAMNQKTGSLRISLQEMHIDQNFALLLPEINEGAYLRMEISDTGHGIPPEMLGRIFEPYFTTKKRGEGTGLGLAIVQGVLKDHGGAITVSSEVGKGTSLFLYLPQLKPFPSQPEEYHCEIPNPRGKNQMILFVDDEQALVELAQVLLERLGYRVVGTTSGLEALELIRSQPETFDLVITDLMMPQMTGVDLAVELARVKPTLPVILCTGFSDPISSVPVSYDGIQEILHKPIASLDLAMSIERVLAKVSREP